MKGRTSTEKINCEGCLPPFLSDDRYYMKMNFYKRMFDSNLNRAGTPEILNLTLEAAHPVKRGSVGFWITLIEMILSKKLFLLSQKRWEF